MEGRGAAAGGWVGAGATDAAAGAWAGRGAEAGGGAAGAMAWVVAATA